MFDIFKITNIHFLLFQKWIKNINLCAKKKVPNDQKCFFLLKLYIFFHFPGHSAEATADLSKMMQVTATNVNTGGDIQNEKVNYMGYYSTHEQSMETVVDIQSKMTESDLKSIFSNGKQKLLINAAESELVKKIELGSANCY